RPAYRVAPAAMAGAAGRRRALRRGEDSRTVWGVPASAGFMCPWSLRSSRLRRPSPIAESARAYSGVRERRVASVATSVRYFARRAQSLDWVKWPRPRLGHAGDLGYREPRRPAGPFA